MLELVGRITDGDALHALGMRRFSDLSFFIDAATRGLLLAGPDLRYRHFRDWMTPRLPNPSVHWVEHLANEARGDDARAVALLQETLAAFLKEEAGDGDGKA